MPDNPRQNITFKSNGRQAHGYLKKPAGGKGPGLIVIQEWWGLDDHMVEITDRFAQEGFVALAPDLYGGKVAHSADDASKYLTELPAEEAAKDLAGAIDYLLNDSDVTSKKVGTVGFCMGGGFVLQMAAQQGERVAAAVPFYGVGPGVPESYTSVSADIQGHYGEKDAMYPVEQAKEQEAKIKKESKGSVEFFYYPAGHAFLNDKNPMGTYDAEQAKLAWGRTVEFLKSHLS